MVKQVHSLAHSPRNRPQIVQRNSETYQPITKAITIQGINIAAQSDPKINRILRQGHIVRSASSNKPDKPWKNITVHHNDIDLNVFLHDPDVSGVCSVDLSGVGKNIETAISQTKPLSDKDSEPVQTIKIAMDNLYEAKFGKRRDLAQTMHARQAM
jgi:hypothetical protein